MAMVIDGGMHAFNALVFPQNNSVRNYVVNSIQQLSDQIGSVGREVYDRAMSMYNDYFGIEAELARQRAIVITGGVTNPNAIVSYSSVIEFQNASPIMQRYLIQNPTVKQMYDAERIDGWFNDTNRVSPGVGKTQYDYRRATNEMFVENGDRIQCYTYLEDLDDGDRELTSVEKSYVLGSWEAMDLIMKHSRVDPTSLDANEIA